jgi:hypothetical protein
MKTEITTVINERITTIAADLYAADPAARFTCAFCRHYCAGHLCGAGKQQAWRGASLYPRVVGFVPRLITTACEGFALAVEVGAC